MNIDQKKCDKLRNIFDEGTAAKHGSLLFRIQLKRDSEK